MCCLQGHKTGLFRHYLAPSICSGFLLLSKYPLSFLFCLSVMSGSCRLSCLHTSLQFIIITRYCNNVLTGGKNSCWGRRGKGIFPNKKLERMRKRRAVSSTTTWAAAGKLRRSLSKRRKAWNQNESKRWQDVFRMVGKEDESVAKSWFNRGGEEVRRNGRDPRYNCLAGYE